MNGILTLRKIKNIAAANNRLQVSLSLLAIHVSWKHLAVLRVIMQIVIICKYKESVPALHSSSSSNFHRY